MTVSNGVIDSPNFILCLELLAWVGQVEMDESLRDAVEGGLLDTDWDSDRRFELPLGRLEISVAKDEESYVSVQVKSAQADIQAVELALHVDAGYRMMLK
ncbi:hypothetical protein [Deinococcus sp. UYEF24]